jgi:hypothetical protein
MPSQRMNAPPTPPTPPRAARVPQSIPTERISSAMTVMHKRVMPALWLVILIVFSGLAIGVGTLRAAILVPSIAIVLGVLGYLYFRRVLEPLADDVQLAEGAILVRRGKQEAWVALEQFASLGMQQNTRPPRLRITLHQPGAFGAEIDFVPRRDRKFSPFGRTDIYELLCARLGWTQ